MKKLACLIVLSTFTASAISAPLQAGDVQLKAGYMSFDPDVDSDTPFAPVLGGDLTGTANAIDVDDDSAFAISTTYMFSSNFGVELLLTTAFEHDISVDGGALDGAAIGSTEHMPPTLSLVYYPMGDKDSAFQPYLGLGVNYTAFSDEEVDQSFVDTVDAVVTGGSGAVNSADLEIDDSWGAAIQAGFDYSFNDSWLVNASIMYADVSADAEITFNTGDKLTVDSDLDPLIYRVNVGYHF